MQISVYPGNNVVYKSFDSALILLSCCCSLCVTRARNLVKENWGAIRILLKNLSDRRWTCERGRKQSFEFIQCIYVHGYSTARPPTTHTTEDDKHLIKDSHQIIASHEWNYRIRILQIYSLLFHSVTGILCINALWPCLTQRPRRRQRQWPSIGRGGPFSIALRRIPLVPWPLPRTSRNRFKLWIGSCYAYSRCVSVLYGYIDGGRRRPLEWFYIRRRIYRPSFDCKISKNI